MKRLNKNAIKRFCPPITGEPKGVQRPLKQSQTCLPSVSILGEAKPKASMHC